MASENGITYRLQRLETVQEVHGIKIGEHSLMAARLEERMSRLGEDVGECKNALVAMKTAQERRDEEEAKRAAERRKERKADRKWWVGTSIAIIMALLAAATIVAGAL